MPTSRTLLMAASTTLACLWACREGRHHETAASAEMAVLQRQLQGLRTVLAAADRGPLLPFEKVLAVADERMVAELLTSALPFERVVGQRYKVRVEKALVQFQDGFGLVRLDGRATLLQAEEAAVAEITVFGALDIVELDPVSGILRGRVRIIALDARRVDVLGVRSRTAEGLVEDLGRERLDTFSDLASRLEIPIQIEQAVVLPAVGPPGEVRIQAATVPLRVAVVDVKAFSGKLWVSLDVDIKGDAAPAP